MGNQQPSLEQRKAQRSSRKRVGKYTLEMEGCYNYSRRYDLLLCENISIIHIGYDEAGKIPRITFELCDPFIAVGNTFVTGDVNLECYPEQMPNQRILLSSAESTDTELFDTYKLCAMKMLEGDDDYFVVDLNCEMSLHPTMNGQPYPPLLE